VNLPPDDFEQHARAVLRDDPVLLGRLLRLRAQHIAQKREMARAATSPDAATLNAHNKQLLDEAAALLGREKFIEIYGFPPEQKITLVDPNVLKR
jgi:hypothetical protein